jgi:hypothetical protein
MNAPSQEIQGRVRDTVPSLPMTFEEQLSRAFETLTERLRGEIDQHVQRASAELVAAAPYDRDPATRDAARQELELAVAAARREAHDEGLVAGREAGRAEALEQASAGTLQTVKVAFAPRLIDAMRSIERARSLTEVLDALLSGARVDAPRADVWLIRGGGLHQWRAPERGAGAPAESAESLDGDNAMARAARTTTAAVVNGTLAVPMAISGVVVAVLLAEVGTSGSTNDERRTSNDEPRTSNDERRTTNLELLAGYAARSLEALTAFKTARALTQRPKAAATDTPPVVLDDANAEEDTSARRYARLLVSEIKLYHESAVVDGRRDRDLATRLGGEIARARVMYEQRVPPDVRGRTAYFQDELVRTLADGDASLLEPRS